VRGFPPKYLLCTLLVILFAAGCAATVPKGMVETRRILDEIRKSGDDKLLAIEFQSAADALKSGETLLTEGDDEEAEQFFLLSWGKSELLLKNIQAEKARLAEEARLKAEAELREAERLKAEAEQKRLEEERVKEELTRKEEKLRAERERPQPAYHTVKRGETLPQIAARSEVYGEASLWPLLYRANRDQIKDPRVISAGQILRIPRNLSREEITEAKKYAQERALQ